jgi:hypothetical protein
MLQRLQRLAPVIIRVNEALLSFGRPAGNVFISLGCQAASSMLLFSLPADFYLFNALVASCF